MCLELIHHVIILENVKNIPDEEPEKSIGSGAYIFREEKDFFKDLHLGAATTWICDKKFVANNQTKYHDSQKALLQVIAITQSFQNLGIIFLPLSN